MNIAAVLVPLVLVGLALANKGKSAAAGGKPPARGSGKYDSPGGPVMPLLLEQSVDKELAADDNPDALEKLASSLSPSWPLAVAALRTRAAQLRAAQAAGVTPPPTHPANPPAVPPPPPPPSPPPPAIPPVAGPQPSPIAIPPILPVSGDIGGGVSVGPGAPVVTPVDDGTGTVTTLPPITITGTPGGSVAPWDGTTMSVPGYSGDGSLPSIPAHYRGPAAHEETLSVQAALNAWAQESGYPGDDVTAAGAAFPLTTDGDYGTGTQVMAAAFQSYQNATAQSGLTVDGLAGPATQAFLGVYGNLIAGTY